MGIAVRNGKRMCLDQLDKTHGLNPLTSQERHWLWFHILYWDAYFAEVAGVRDAWIEFRQGFKVPRNYNDNDIESDMTELPPEKEGATEVMFMRLRCDWIQGAQKAGLSHLDLASTISTARTNQEQDAAIDELEALFANKYVRYCDPTLPMQFWVLLTAKCMIANIRLSIYCQRRQHNFTAEEGDTLFNLSIKALEYEYMGQTTESLNVFRWHQSDQIPRKAVIFVVAELHKRTIGPEADKAWRQIEQTFSKHPEIVTQIQRPWIRHLGSLVLRAWALREATRQQHQLEAISPPRFITQLRDLRPSEADADSLLSTYWSTVANSSSQYDSIEAVNTLLEDGDDLFRALFDGYGDCPFDIPAMQSWLE